MPTLRRLTTYSLNASVQTYVDDVSRVDKKVGCHSKVCGIDAASIFSLYFQSCQVEVVEFLESFP